MKTKELKEALANVPDDAKVYMDAYASGRACAIRDKCYRYWLRKEQCKKSVNGFLHPKDCAPFIEEQYDFETEKCEMFKPIEQ